jgi:hypothetical protein
VRPQVPVGPLTYDDVHWVVDPDDPALAVHELVDGRFVGRAAACGDEAYRGDRPFPVEVVPGGLTA